MDRQRQDEEKVIQVKNRMFVPEGSDLFLEVEGQKYYFCSKTCQHRYSSPEAEAKKLKRRLIVGWSLSIPSTEITSPGFTNILSPGLISSVFLSVISPRLPM